MTTKILIPTPLRPYADRRDAVEADGQTVGELLADLTRKHAGLRAHLFNEQGKLRSFVNVYVNDEDIRYLQKEQTLVSATDTVSIVPSVAGGTPTDTDTRKWRGAPADLPQLTNDEVKRYSRHLIMPEVGMDGAATTQGGQRAVHRRGRARIAGRNVPCCRRRRHRRYRGLRRRGPQQPPAPDHPRDVGRRPVEAGLGKGSNSRD